MSLTGYLSVKGYPSILIHFKKTREGGTVQVVDKQTRRPIKIIDSRYVEFIHNGRFVRKNVNDLWKNIIPPNKKHNVSRKKRKNPSKRRKNSSRRRKSSRKKSKK